MQRRQLRIPLFHSIIHLPHKLAILSAGHGPKIFLRRLVGGDIGGGNDALDHATNILSTILQRLSGVGVGAQDERHIDLHGLQLGAVVLGLVGRKGVDHGLQAIEDAVAAHVAFGEREVGGAAGGGGGGERRGRGVVER